MDNKDILLSRMVDLRLRSDVSFYIHYREHMARLYAKFDSIALNDEMLASWVIPKKMQGWYDPDLGKQSWKYPIPMDEAFKTIKKQKMVWFKGKKGGEYQG